MKPLLWLSRHAPLPAQLEELARLGLGPVIHDVRVFAEIDDIVARLRAHPGAELMIVAPHGLISKLLDRGIRPLWCDMVPVGLDYARQHPETCVTLLPSTTARSTRYQDRPARAQEFKRFRRLTAIEMRFEDVVPVVPT